MKKTKISIREQKTIMRALQAGVTPSRGLHHIQVGRAGELKSLVDDLECMKEGDSTFRLIIGDYGSGKTFFMHLVRLMAGKMDFATIHADLSPDRRLQSSTGHSQNLYAELMKNIATKTKPDGNAMSTIVENFLDQVCKEAKEKQISEDVVIKERLKDISILRGGYDFAAVISRYWQAHQKGDEETKNNVIRWLRAEYDKKTEAKKDIGVSYIIEDDMFLDALKLMSLFVRQAGYAGLLVSIDEMVNILKMTHVQGRMGNYEKLLGFLNASLQGDAPYLGFIFGGTPEFLEDKKKGIASYEALSSRLAENQFAAKMGETDFSATVLRLAPLSHADLFALLVNIRHVYAGGDPEKYFLPDQALHDFLEHCKQRIGEAYFRTPRNTIKEFLNFLTVVEKKPEYQQNWQTVLGDIDIQKETPTDLTEEDQLEHFKL